jgi:membrane-bound serine protease (ClpP class)
LAFASVAAAQTVPIITIDGAINPVSSKYIIRNIEDAEDENAPCIVILLDTPGGLMSSTEDLTRAIMASNIPVVVYVYPQGGRAASAGVFITYSADIAAMTPGTRIGAAHPVSMMGGAGKADSSAAMMEKVANDAVANVRSIAKQRGRNDEWPEKAIHDSESITENEALEMNVIDFIAVDVDDLLEKLDGFAYGPEKADTLELLHPRSDERPMTSVEDFLFTLLNPNVAYLLMMLGIVGIYLELQNPGGILPGVVGVIALLLALYVFQILPFNYVGIAFIILAIGLFVAEALTVTFGLLTTGGVVSMLAGSFLLTSGNPSLFTISWEVIIPTVAVMSLIIIFVLFKAVQAVVSKPVSGRDGMVGEHGIVAEKAVSGSSNFYIDIHGELWAATGEELKPGMEVVVESVEGNKLRIKKV